MSGNKKVCSGICITIVSCMMLSLAIAVKNAISEIPERESGRQSYSLLIPGSQDESKSRAVASEKAFCDEVNFKFREYGWNRIRCNPDRWNVYDYSSRGNPLFYQEFGFNDFHNQGPVNLVMCGVHGDEPPSIYLCFHLTRHILFDSPDSLKNFRVVIAPVVNPDGFFASTRQNANGVDLNRNLPTDDWDDLAHRVWTQYNEDPRKYPGISSGSEVESRFQTYLIDRYRPDKIISVHAPLGFLDYDGPGDQKYYNLIRVEKRAKYLGVSIETNTKRFVKFVDYRYFPGSLGNYAGNEREIPTYTVELPTVRYTEAHNYWNTLKYALIKALRYEVYDGHDVNPFFELQYMTEQAGNRADYPLKTLGLGAYNDSHVIVKAESGKNKMLSDQSIAD